MGIASREVSGRPHKWSLRGGDLLQTSSIGVLVVILFLVAILSVTTKNFLSMVNFRIIAEIVSTTAIVGMAQMVIIGLGGMNLSVGAIGGLAGVVTGGLMADTHLPSPIAAAGGLAVGMFCGVFNGLFIVRLSISGATSFLVTLAAGSILTGFILGITQSVPFYNLPDDFKFIGNTQVGGIPLLLFVMAGVAILVNFLFARLGLGRQILAIGGNLRAAELSGVPINRVVITAHILSGLLAASAGILLVSRLGSAHPDVGKDWMLASFAAPIIGGTRLAGGKVSVVGAVLGAILLALIADGLIFLKIDIYWNTLIQGLIILGAVSLDRLRMISAEHLERQRR